MEAKSNAKSATCVRWLKRYRESTPWGALNNRLGGNFTKVKKKNDTPGSPPKATFARRAESSCNLTRTAALAGVPLPSELTGLGCETLHIDAVGPRRALLEGRETDRAMTAN